MTPLEALERDFRNRCAEREYAIQTGDTERAFRLAKAIDDLLRQRCEGIDEPPTPTKADWP